MRTPEPHASSDDVTTYKVQFRLKGKQSSETFDTKREAEQAATVPTLDQVAADHIEHLTSVTDGTRLDYSRLWVYTLKELFRYILKSLSYPMPRSFAFAPARLHSATPSQPGNQPVP
jgi:hypothetical protein